jgi:hypothetical protein
MAILLLFASTQLSVTCYAQLLKRWNRLFTLKQEFGNCPEWPTILGNIYHNLASLLFP